MECIFGPPGDFLDDPPARLKADDGLAKVLGAGLFKFGDSGYEAVRIGTKWGEAVCKPSGRAFSPKTHPTETWNLDTVAYPSAIAVVKDVKDIKECVRYCASTKTPLAIAGGRHSHKCMVQDSLVIDLQRMRKCELFMIGEETFLKCEGGALNGDAHAALDGSGFCITLGHHPGTGLGGLVQQGGHGPLEKVMGLSVDALVSAELVTADSSLVQCSATENPDLFWCVQGGCGNFGVVTSFVFKPLPMAKQMLPCLTRVHLPVPLVTPSRFRVIKNFKENCDKMPRIVSPLLILTSFEMVELYYYLGDQLFETDGPEALEGYRSFGSPVVEELKSRDYINEISWDIVGPSFSENLAGSYYSTSAMLFVMDDAAMRIIAEAMARCPNSKCQVIFNQLGGKAADVAKDATAVYHRDAKYWLIILGKWEATLLNTAQQERDIAMKWARKLRDDLLPYCSGRYGSLSSDYTNNDVSGNDPLNLATWGQNYPKLRRLKRRYDPDNLFHLNDNIKPSPPSDL